MKRFVCTFLVFVGCLAVFLSGSICLAGKNREVIIGGLFSLTGNWSTLGATSTAAMELATSDVNTYLAQHGVPLRIRPCIEDTKLRPDLALEHLQTLKARGIRIVVGPQSSAEAQHLKTYADEQGMIIVSQGSTAHALALPDDNLFRFCPDDVLEGKAIAALMHDDGIKAYLSLGRYDPGNSGLNLSIRKAFADRGGALVGGVRYSPEFETDFNAELKYLEAKLSQAQSIYGKDVAIYAAAFDEITRIFNQAVKEGYASLSTVRWYGSNGVAKSAVLVNNASAAAFAEKTGYPAPIFGLDETLRGKWEPVARHIQDVTGIMPDTYALSVYDAVWVASLAYLRADIDCSIGDLKAAFVRQANGYKGITGSTSLNSVGDRKFGNYDFWAIRDGVWRQVAVYDEPSENITRLVAQ